MLGLDLSPQFPSRGMQISQRRGSGDILEWEWLKTCLTKKELLLEVSMYSATALAGR